MHIHEYIRICVSSVVGDNDVIWGWVECAGENGDTKNAAFRQYDELFEQAMKIHKLYTRLFDGDVDIGEDESEEQEMVRISIQLGRTLRRIRRVIELRWNVVESFASADCSNQISTNGREQTESKNG